MLRITLQKMLVLLRLAIVMSLTGYSLPTASAAMHGAWANSDLMQSHDHQTQSGGHHDAASADHADGDNAASHDDDAAKKIAKQECCNSFCVSMAIVTGTIPVGGPQVASIREFIDDAHIFGESPPLHRPPNI